MLPSSIAVVLCGGGALLALLLVLIRSGLWSLLFKRPGSRVGNLQWESRGAVPLKEKRYTPQGMTWVDGRIIFANSWKNTRSRVYEIDPSSMAIGRFFDMPEGAVHTSGLAWDGKRLWAVDYIANRAYCIDLQSSLDKGAVEILGSFETTLKGTSACCIIPWKGKSCLAISDFRRSRNTIYVNMYDAMDSGSAAGHIEFRYDNEGFSQGLEFFDGHLYESENKLGTDIINKIDPALLERERSSARATVVQFRAPSRGVEDLAWDGHNLWTSDETTFEFYRGAFEQP